MEKAEIKLTMDAERMEALTYYLQERSKTQLQNELGKVLEKLYQETVPKDVREYIERPPKKPSPPKSKPKPKSTAPPKPEAEK